MDDGLPPRILSAIGTSASQLRADLLDHYRQAG
jgi:hypothetical protein